MRHWLGAVIRDRRHHRARRPLRRESHKIRNREGGNSPAFEGRSFGAVGTYDRIVARATIAVSPDDPHNTVIVDIDRAPRNAQGLVEADDRCRNPASDDRGQRQSPPVL